MLFLSSLIPAGCSRKMLAQWHSLIFNWNSVYRRGESVIDFTRNELRIRKAELRSAYRCFSNNLVGLENILFI